MVTHTIGYKIPEYFLNYNNSKDVYEQELDSEDFSVYDGIFKSIQGNKTRSYLLFELAYKTIRMIT